MGIVNVTPDSFSDGGQFDSVQAAVEHAKALEVDGADILDIGGESTRPDSEPVRLFDELERVIPVIEQLAPQVNVPISVDTTKAELARQAIAAGASIVNDISGLEMDAEMVGVCADSDVGVICMHMQGTPQTMQQEPHYDDVVVEVCEYLKQRIKVMNAAGIAAERIVLDPGIGFGKTAEHNLQILSAISSFRSLGRPVLIGHSRKRFLSKVLGRQVEERTMGTAGVAVALAAQSTDIIRVHDVREIRDALTAYRAVMR
ncbi:MAG: dihydropteroate synthase [Planctomycetaceae bacterium]|nr:dihydropteroate synthase [Planctomycetaceae bacterium]